MYSHKGFYGQRILMKFEPKMSYISFLPSLSSASLQIANTISISMHAMVRFPIRIFHFDTWTFSICMKWLEMISFAKSRILLFHAIIQIIFFCCICFCDKKKCIKFTMMKKQTAAWTKKSVVVRDKQDSLKCITFFFSG